MIARIIIGVLFLVFAAVQYNDPDPWMWIIIYGLVGVVAIVAAFRSVPKPIYWILIILLAAGTAYYIPLMMEWVGDGMPSIVGEMKARTPYIEWMREFLGLGLCLAAMIWLNKKPLHPPISNS